MTKTIYDYFTYGFEIEGLFTKQSIRKITENLERRKIDIDIKSDGSVSVRPTKLDIEYIDERECAIGVFKKFKDMLKAMSFFENDNNYFYDTSCGLHIHIKPIQHHKELKAMILDYNLILNLQSWVKNNLCNCNNNRLLHNNNYCQNYTSFKNAHYSVAHNDKYKFIKNHESGTVEFRFFSPCEHKIDNVSIFFDYLFKILSKTKPLKEKTFILPKALSIPKQNYNHNLGLIENVKVNAYYPPALKEPLKNQIINLNYKTSCV